MESPRGETVKSEPEAFDFNFNNDGDDTNNELDDLKFGNSSLKQIKKRCKMKKRKRLISVILNKENMETCSLVKHNLPNLQKYDHEEPLLSWKPNQGKKMKSRSKCLRNTFSASSPNAFSIDKYEHFYRDEDFLRPYVESSVSMGAKVEVPEPGYLECHTIFSSTSVSDSSNCEQVDSMATVSNEPENVNAHNLQNESPYHTEETQLCSLNEVSYEYSDEYLNPKFDVGVSGREIVKVDSPSFMSSYHTQEPQLCSLNEVSYEYIEYLKPKFDLGVSGWEIVKVDSPEIVSYEYSDFSEFKKEERIVNSIPYVVSSEPMSATKDYNCQSNSPNHEMPWQTSSYNLIQVPEIPGACGLETKDLLKPIGEHLCSTWNGDSFEYKENGDADFGASFSGRDIVKLDSAEIIRYQFSDSERFGKEDSILYLLPYVVSSEPLSPPKDHCTDLQDRFRSNSSEQKMVWQTSNYDQVGVEMNSDNSLQCLVKPNGGNVCSNESRTVHDWPSNNGNFGINLCFDSDLYLRSSFLNPETHLFPTSGVCPLARKQSLLPAYEPTTSFNISDEPKGSPGPQDFHQKKQKHHPERLLSGRKAISPTSQEKLYQAMELAGWSGDKHQKCRGKLNFGNQTNHRILNAQELDPMRRDGTNIRTKSIIRKAKEDKKVSTTKGNLMVTHPIASTVRRSQSVIAFSQRQMRDIESLATRLTTELKSMRDIMMGNLQFKVSSATAVKENADEQIRIAIENATRAEETARKWLSIMARDCNRFCKIMRLTEDGNATSAPKINKERKIAFADESGGKLCHVKVFKNDENTASSQECGSEKQILLV